MDNLMIREVQPNDISAIKKVVTEVWDWVSLIEDKKILDATIGLYLNPVLQESTFGRVAVLNDRVIGVIFGSVKGQPYNYRMLQEDATSHALTLLGAPETDRKNIYEYLTKTYSVYDQLSSDIADSYDGTLVFLVLASESQGLGVGKSLWLAVKEYFQQNNVESLYLFSDTECNFGFYEHLGFKRKREQDVTYYFEDETYEMTQFLYEYSM